MKKHVMLLIDEDPSFIESVNAFWLHSTLRNIVEFKAFTSLHSMEQAAYYRRSDVLLAVSEQIYQNMSESGTFVKVVVLSESVIEHSTEAVEKGGIARILKYQSLAKLFGMLCELDEAWNRPNQARGLREEESATQLLTVYSASGGAGKTTVALHIARTLALAKYRTLFVSLESLSASHRWLYGAGESPQDDRLSQLIYFLTTDNEKLRHKLPGFIDIHGATGLHYIANSWQIREMEEMGSETTVRLLQAFKSIGNFQYIVVDTPSALQQRTVSALTLSDEIIWLLLGDAFCVHKSRQAIDYLPRLRRIHAVVNKYTGRISASAFNPGMEPAYFLPYIPEWKQLNQSDLLFNHRLFAEAVKGLVADLVIHPSALRRGAG